MAGLIYPDFLVSPRRLYNLLYGSEKLRSYSKLDAIYQVFVLEFSSIGDTESFQYNISPGKVGFLWSLGYRVSSAMVGNLSGTVNIDNLYVFLDTVHLRPEYDFEFTELSKVGVSITGRWVSATASAGSIQVHALGFEIDNRFYREYIEPLYEKIGRELGMPI